MKNYCFQHTICFSTVEESLFHANSCRKAMAPYTCNFFNTNGKLCGRVFKNGVLLYDHSLKVHKIYICTDCEFVGEEFLELRRHKHIGALGGRIRKYHFNYIISHI